MVILLNQMPSMSLGGVWQGLYLKKERALKGMYYDESEIYVQHTNTILSLVMNTIGRVHVKII